MRKSLHTRLLLAASAALLAFLGLAGIALDKAFQNRTEVAVEDRLKGQVFNLLTAAELDRDGRLRMLEELPEPRFGRIDSGLYGEILNAPGQIVWQSRSLLDKRLPGAVMLSPGRVSFEWSQMENRDPVFLYRFGVGWEIPGGDISAFMFSVAEDTRRYNNEIGAFRRTLWAWLGGAALVLLLVQVFVLRWSLKPLAEVATEIGEVERGEREYLENNHPREISSLTESVNKLLGSERDRQRRYRNNMDDLAHSLKTPLAVLKGWLDSQSGHDGRQEAEQQIERIGQSVEYHLRRTASGAAIFSKPVEVGPIVSELVSALHKVYAGRNIETSADLPADLVFFGDKGDIMEILGNVLDNAFKYCTTSVCIKGASVGETSRPGLRIEVSDDGAGFPDSLGSRVLNRGVRADTRTKGYGIGLASTRDIVGIYGGTLDIGNQKPHGAIVAITLPGG